MHAFAGLLFYVHVCLKAHSLLTTNYKDTKDKCRHVKKIKCKGTHVGIFDPAL